MTDTYNNKPTRVRITPGFTCGSTDNRYKCWDNLDNLKSNGTAYCRHPNYTSPTIAGKNGTYKQPAPLDLTEYGYNFPSDTIISQIAVTYTVQTFINNGHYASFSHPSVSLLNTGLASKQYTNNKIDETARSVTHYWFNVPVSLLNSKAFGIRFEFDQNRATTPGRIELSNVDMEITVEDYQDKIDLNIDVPSRLTTGITTEATVKIDKYSDDAYQGEVEIDLPFGVEIIGEPTRNDGFYYTVTQKTYEGNVYQHVRWMMDLPDGRTNSVLKFNVKAIRPSNTFTCSKPKRITQFKATEIYQEVEYSTILTVTQIEAVVTSDFVEDNKSLRANTVYSFTTKVYSNDPMWYVKTLHLKFRDGIDVIDNGFEIYSDVDHVTDFYYDSNLGEYLITFESVRKLDNVEVPIDVIFTTAGEYDFKAWMTITSTGERVSPVWQRSCVVLSTDYQKIGFSRILLNSYTDGMADGIEYTMGSLMKITQTGQSYELNDFGNNYRIGVYNGGASDITDEIDFIDNVVWAENISTTKASEQTVQFTYNSEEPLYLIYSHTYTADATGPYVTVNFSEPILAESSCYEQVRDNTGISLKPVQNVLMDLDYATAEMKTTTEEINRVAIDEWNDGGIFEKDISILGMSLTFDYEITNNCTVEAELYVGGRLSGTRDILLYTGESTATVGNVYDLFGLSPSDLINRDESMIRPFEIRFFVSNPYHTVNTVNIKNCVLTIEYIRRSSCQYGFTLDGEYSKDYGIILNEVSHPRGTKNDKSLYHVSGTDETIVNRLNVDSKDIELQITLGNSCEIEEQQYIIDRIVELFTNNRYLDSNKPIPKKLVFDHLPDRYFEVVRVDDFDDKFTIGKYEAKIKLLVPPGSTYDLEETVTGKHGFSPSSIAVRPYITYLSTTAGNLRVYEEQAQQEFFVQDNRINNGGLVQIDCQNRKVYIDTVDITESVDYNSMWFKLRGEYSFTSETGNVVRVAYRIRRG